MGGFSTPFHSQHSPLIHPPTHPHHSVAYDADGETETPAYDSDSSSTIRLSNGMVLYLREVDKYVVLSRQPSTHPPTYPLSPTHPPQLPGPGGVDPGGEL